MLKMNINSNATRQMEALMNKIDTFPNRIASAQQSALYRTSNNLGQKLYNRFPASRYLDFVISTRGSLGYSLTITPMKNEKTSNGADAYIAASILLKGRKAYTVRGKRGNLMVLRDASVPPYPRVLRIASIPYSKGHSDEIKTEARNIIIQNLEFAVKRFGFGPLGGTSGLTDLPYVRSRVGQ
jgi:hypothetical protein